MKSNAQPDAATTATQPANVGTYHGPRRSVSFDRWFRYPAGFNQEVLATCFEAVQVGRGSLVVDPFAGACTVGTAALSRGVRFRGIEAHPLIAQLGQLKTTAPPRADAELALKNVCEGGATAEVVGEHPLVMSCFEPATLQTLVQIRARIDSEAGGAWTPWLTWALLATLRDVAAVAVGWPYQRPGKARQPPYRDALARFQQRFREMVKDLDDAKWSPTAGSVTAGDARELATWQAALVTEKPNASISSPPYLNNFDYADATRLEVYFLRQATSWRELCDRFRHQMLIATTQQTSVKQREADLERLDALGATGRAVEEIIEKLAVERGRRPRGKEYDAAVAGYFVGIAAVLNHLRAAMTPGGRAAWVIGDSAPYGVFIDTPGLVGQLAQHHGFEVTACHLIRDRGQRWRTNGTRHQVALTERLLVFQRP